MNRDFKALKGGYMIFEVKTFFFVFVVISKSFASEASL